MYISTQYKDWIRTILSERTGSYADGKHQYIIGCSANLIRKRNKGWTSFLDTPEGKAASESMKDSKHVFQQIMNRGLAEAFNTSYWRPSDIEGLLLTVDYRSYLHWEKFEPILHAMPEPGEIKFSYVNCHPADAKHHITFLSNFTCTGKTSGAVVTVEISRSNLRRMEGMTDFFPICRYGESPIHATALSVHLSEWQIYKTHEERDKIWATGISKEYYKKERESFGSLLPITLPSDDWAELSCFRVYSQVQRMKQPGDKDGAFTKRPPNLGSFTMLEFRVMRSISNAYICQHRYKRWSNYEAYAERGEYKAAKLSDSRIEEYGWDSNWTRMPVTHFAQVCAAVKTGTASIGSKHCMTDYARYLRRMSDLSLGSELSCPVLHRGDSLPNDTVMSRLESVAVGKMLTATKYHDGDMIMGCMQCYLNPEFIRAQKSIWSDVVLSRQANLFAKHGCDFEKWELPGATFDL